MLKPLTMWITANWKILKEMGIPGHLTCLLRNLLLPDLHTDFSRGRSGGLVFPSLSEFSLFEVVVFYKITANIELANIELLSLGEIDDLVI